MKNLLTSKTTSTDYFIVAVLRSETAGDDG